MGGCSFYIRCEVSAAALEDRALAASPRDGFSGALPPLPDLDQPLPPAFRRYLESLPPRQAISALSAYSLDPARAMDEPGTPLAEAIAAPLLEDLDRFLAQRFPDPWPATAQVSDGYLTAFPPAVYVRREPDGEDWVVQLHFRGDSGMALVSAALSAHWAEGWYSARRVELDALLRSSGVSPRARVEATETRFIPTAAHGYAQLVLRKPGDASPSGGAHRPDRGAETSTRTVSRLISDHPFALDRSQQELLGDHALVDALGERFAEELQREGCRCQLCAPDFDLARIEDL